MNLRWVAPGSEQRRACIDNGLGEPTMLVVEQNVYADGRILRSAVEDQVRPTVTVQIAGGDVSEQVRRRVRHQRHRRLERAIAVTERQRVPGGGEIQLPVPVEIGYRYSTSTRGARRGAFQRKRAIAVVEVG